MYKGRFMWYTLAERHYNAEDVAMDPREQREREDYQRFLAENEEARKRQLLAKERARTEAEGRQKRKVLDGEKFKSYLDVINKDEFKDPQRDSTKPITTADIAEVQMDMVSFGQGRSINEQF